jgi:hypothetical protein
VKVVALNAQGRPIGETHHRAKLSDDEVDTILYLREQGLSYAAIAAKWDEPGRHIAKSTVRKVCLGETRAQMPDRYKSRT